MRTNYGIPLRYVPYYATASLIITTYSAQLSLLIHKITWEYFGTFVSLKATLPPRADSVIQLGMT